MIEIKRIQRQPDLAQAIYAVMVTVSTKAVASLTNAVIAVIIAIILTKILRPTVESRLE